MPKITICVPTYNASEFVSEALDSILEQDEQDFKVVLVDDASTDNTLEILEGYCRKDSRFELQRHAENSGACGLAIKEVLSCCDTEYFMWFGADDRLTKSYISKLIERINSSGADYAYSDFELIDSLGKHVGIWRYPMYDLFSYIERFLNTFSGALPMNGVLKLSKLRELNMGWLIYNGESRSSDTINGIYFRMNGVHMSRLDEPVFQYRTHIGQLTRQTDKRWLSDKNVIDFVFEALPEIVDSISTSKKMTREEFLVVCYREALVRIQQRGRSVQYS